MKLNFWNVVSGIWQHNNKYPFAWYSYHLTEESHCVFLFVSPYDLNRVEWEYGNVTQFHASAYMRFLKLCS